MLVLLLPPIFLGIIRKTKAGMQGRAGASILQPIYDLSKLLRKGETISVVTSWIFRSTTAINFSIVLLIAFLTPWISFEPALFITTQRFRSVAAEGGSAAPAVSSNFHVKSVSINGMSIYSQPDDNQEQADASADQSRNKDEEQSFLEHATTASDIFLIIYLFALSRLLTVLSALDSGSAFGGVGASREVTLALLVEPAIVLALGSLGCAAHSSDLYRIFGWANSEMTNSPALWFISGTSLFLASIVEFSRMPVDDPTSHNELATVREALIFENSGRNLALVEFTHLLKMTVFFGLTGQCFLHCIACFVSINHWLRDILSVLFLVLLAVSIGLIESITIKLRWNKVPELIAYSVAMSILSAFIAIGVNH
jgi:formate hydrogenlyase subunit 4